MAYDNITSLPEWLSNGFCGLATGIGFTIRAVGTDDEEIIFVARRPIIMGGIGDFVNKADLADRSFFLHMPSISSSTRRSEQALWEEFDHDCPRILGGLLDAVSAGMRMLPQVQLARMSRMADAERWGEAVARALGWAPGTFSTALGSNRAAASQSALEDSPVGATVVALITQYRRFVGTMQELLQALTAVTPFKTSRADWPKTPRSLSCALGHVTPQLRSIGICVEFERTASRRLVKIGIADTDDNAATEALKARYDEHMRSCFQRRAAADDQV